MDISSNNFNTLKSLFTKIEKNNQYKLTLDFDGKIEHIEEELFQKITKRMIYQEKNGGLNWNFKMKNLLTVSLNRRY